MGAVKTSKSLCHGSAQTQLTGVRVNFLRAFCRNFTLTLLSGPRSNGLIVKKNKTA